MYESDDKMVSHPSHYKSKNGMEVINVIEAFTGELSGIEATDTGNIIKYACRWYAKNGIQDLKKIIWYTQHLIDHLEAKEKEITICDEIDSANLYGNNEVIAIMIKNENDVWQCHICDWNTGHGCKCPKGCNAQGYNTCTNFKLKQLSGKKCATCDKNGTLICDSGECQNYSLYKLEEKITPKTQKESK